MIIFVNGAFGIGKTTVARVLARRFPRSMVFDPEKIGGPLQLAARLLGRRVEDFQNLRSWRTLTLVGLGAARALSPTVIVPMAFSDGRYLDEMLRGAERLDRRVYHFCLVAPLAVVQHRLQSRGADPVSNAWEYRRAAECCAAHKDARFLHHIDATTSTPSELAAEIGNATIQLSGAQAIQQSR